MAIAAAVAGTLAGWSAGAAARPAPIARSAGLIREVEPVSSGPAQALFVARQPAGRQSAELDAISVTALNSARGLAVNAGTASRAKSRRPLTPRRIARRLLHHFHWGRRQFRYLNPLWDRESGWNVHAFNPYSGAYGIPQAVPGAKMASAGRRWRTSAATQIRWGLRYIKYQYGSPRAAWDHELATGWY